MVMVRLARFRAGAVVLRPVQRSAAVLIQAALGRRAERVIGGHVVERELGYPKTVPCLKCDRPMLALNRGQRIHADGCSRRGDDEE
jgi:hypothetical protein